MSSLVLVLGLMAKQMWPSEPCSTQVAADRCLLVVLVKDQAGELMDEPLRVRLVMGGTQTEIKSQNGWALFALAWHGLAAPPKLKVAVTSLLPCPEHSCEYGGPHEMVEDDGATYFEVPHEMVGHAGSIFFEDPELGQKNRCVRELLAAQLCLSDRDGPPAKNCPRPTSVDLAVVKDGNENQAIDFGNLAEKLFGVDHGPRKLRVSLPFRNLPLYWRAGSDPVPAAFDSNVGFVTRSFDFTAISEQGSGFEAIASAPCPDDCPDAVYQAIEHAAQSHWKKQKVEQFLMANDLSVQTPAGRLVAVANSRTGVSIHPVSVNEVEAEFIVDRCARTGDKPLCLSGDVCRSKVDPHVACLPFQSLDQIMTSTTETNFGKSKYTDFFHLPASPVF